MKTDAFCAEQHRVEFNRNAVNVTPSFDLALHTAKPKGEVQSSNEVDLDGYGRVAVMRNEQSWIVRGRKVSNGELIRFPTVTKGTGKAIWLSIGIDGKIRRLIKLKEEIELKPNRRVEFEPGTVEVIEVE